MSRQGNKECAQAENEQSFPAFLLPCRRLLYTLIKKIEIFNSVKGEDGNKHVPITIHFRSVDIVTVPDEEEIIAAMEEIRNNPTKVA